MKQRERWLRVLIGSSAILVFAVSGLLVAGVLWKGLPQLHFSWIFGPYALLQHQYGILPMLLHTGVLILVTLAFALPIGLGCGLWISQYAAGSRWAALLEQGIGFLSGLPSVLFGLFGYGVFCQTFGLGTSLLSAGLTMALCVLSPWIQGVIASLRRIPMERIEGALALGSSQRALIWTVLIPDALPDLIASVLCIIGRVLGESAAVLFTAGLSYQMPSGVFSSILESGRTLTVHLYQLLRESGSETAGQEAFGVAAVLLIIVWGLYRMAALVQKIGSRKGNGWWKRQ